jgi:hypothetical protein
MPLTECRECQGQISEEARTCPHCGVRKPWKNDAWSKRQEEASYYKAVAIVGFLVAIFLQAVIGSLIEAATAPQAIESDTATASASVADSAVSAESVTSRVIDTSKGKFTIPGYCWLDGRDLEARPPLTVQNINVWNAVRRSAVVCRLQHGQRIETLAAEQNATEDRWYVKIRRNDCEGWLPEDWLSNQRHSPVGDQV